MFLHTLMDRKKFDRKAKRKASNKKKKKKKKTLFTQKQNHMKENNDSRVEIFLGDPNFYIWPRGKCHASIGNLARRCLVFHLGAR